MNRSLLRHQEFQMNLSIDKTSIPFNDGTTHVKFLLVIKLLFRQIDFDGRWFGKSWIRSEQNESLLIDWYLINQLHS